MSSSRVRVGTEKIRGEVYVKCWVRQQSVMAAGGRRPARRLTAARVATGIFNAFVFTHLPVAGNCKSHQGYQDRDNNEHRHRAIPCSCETQIYKKGSATAID